MELSLLTFAVLALVVVMTPGPTVLLALSNGSRFGITAAGVGIVGATISDAVLITAAGLGLGAILAASAFWFGVVKWIGVAYLVWLGTQMIRSSGQLGSAAHPSEINRSTTLRNYTTIFERAFSSRSQILRAICSSQLSYLSSSPRQSQCFLSTFNWH